MLWPSFTVLCSPQVDHLFFLSLASLSRSIITIHHTHFACALCHFYYGIYKWSWIFHIYMISCYYNTTHSSSLFCKFVLRADLSFVQGYFCFGTNMVAFLYVFCKIISFFLLHMYILLVLGSVASIDYVEYRAFLLQIRVE